jgi:hypothetical protein
MAEFTAVGVDQCMPCSFAKHPYLELKILQKQLLGYSRSPNSGFQTQFVKKY